MEIEYTYGYTRLIKPGEYQGEEPSSFVLNHADLLQLEAFIKELRSTGVLQDIRRGPDLPFGSR